MATSTIPSPCPKSNLTRRQALAGTAAIGALALPVGAALATEAPGIYERFTRTALERPELMRRFARVPQADGADPHLDWWRERTELKRRADAMIVPEDEDSAEQAALWSQQWDFDHLIMETAPQTAAGAVVVAATLLASWDELGDVETGGSQWEQSGLTLARYILDQAPADLRARVLGGAA